MSKAEDARLGLTKGTTAALERLYDRLPTIQCKGLCQGSCGPIACSQAEWKRVNAATDGKASNLNHDFTCGALAEGRCAAYAVRPLICRLYGVVKKMRCPHGCKPSRWLEDQEAAQLLEAANRISANGGAAGVGGHRESIQFLSEYGRVIEELNDPAER